MRRLTILVISLVCVSPLSAQGVVGGYALDVVTSKPLSCIEVGLVDDGGRRVASTRTRVDGTFEFAAPDSGIYRFLFLAGGYPPVMSQPDTLSPTANVDRAYRVDMRIDSLRTAYIDTVAFLSWIGARGGESPKHPRGRNGSGRAGRALVRFTIDETGIVVPGSAVVEASSHPEYAKAVLSYLPKARFEPLDSTKARPGCVLMLMPFEFNMAR